MAERYVVEFTTAAARQIKKLPPLARGRMIDAATALAADPRPQDARKLAGEDAAWRIRVGDYRMIYEVADAALTVTVVRAAHRREVYDR
ncbi:MAG: type II toxin-antitoxin system RelE family toxin [Candidatus Nanopelagicales bacterium]